MDNYACMLVSWLSRRNLYRRFTRLFDVRSRNGRLAWKKSFEGKMVRWLGNNLRAATEARTQVSQTMVALPSSPPPPFLILFLLALTHSLSLAYLLSLSVSIFDIIDYNYPSLRGVGSYPHLCVCGGGGGAQVCQYYFRRGIFFHS